MVKHMILWKLRENLSEEEKQAVMAKAKAGLEGLLGQIDGLTDIHVQTEALPSSNADMMLDSTFVDAAALAGYQVHPAHVAVASGIVRPNAEVRLCLDFEA